MKVRKDQWSGKEGAWVKSSHPFAFEINSKVQEIKGQVNEYIQKMVNFGKFLTVEGVMASLSNKVDNKSFLDFMQRYIIRPPEKLEPNTIKKYATTLSHLRKFK